MGPSIKMQQQNINQKKKNYAKGHKSDDKTCLFIFSCLLNRYIFHNYCIFIFNSQNEDMRISSSDHTITKWENNKWRKKIEGLTPIVKQRNWLTMLPASKIWNVWPYVASVSLIRCKHWENCTSKGIGKCFKSDSFIISSPFPHRLEH